MTDGFDHDVRPVLASQLTDPPVAGGSRTSVDAELFRDVRAVDGVDTGDVLRARRFGRTREQQPDRALADDADVPTLEVGQLLDGVEHTGQRLQADGLRRGQRRIVGRQLVSVVSRRVPSSRRTRMPNPPRGRRADVRDDGWRSPPRRPRGSGSRPFRRRCGRRRPEVGRAHRERPACRCRRPRRPRTAAAPGGRRGARVSCQGSTSARTDTGATIR